MLGHGLPPAHHPRARVIGGVVRGKRSALAGPVIVAGDTSAGISEYNVIRDRRERGLSSLAVRRVGLSTASPC
jgi:hypothetical protein